MREIDQMTADLEAAMKVHSVRALEATRTTAESMERAAKQHSTPMYGVNVMTQVIHSGNKSTVKVRATSTKTGIGKVHGGEAAIIKQAARSMDAVARGAGLTGGG